jgi:glyoxylase-like metal-dependent hydrolase (beta-lactamase superfamily II)
MIEEMCPGLHRIEVPLPKNPLKSLNSYVVESRERNLIVDTGMNRPECLNAMRAGLAQLDVDLARTDFFITHLHADHLGLVSELATAGSKVYFSRPDADVILSGGFWEYMLEFARVHGFPEDEIEQALLRHPGYKYSPKTVPEFTTVREGDIIGVGGYTFDCVETPGHTRGHMCLYERDKKILVSGDHILGDITPNISQWDSEENTLEQYLTSLEKTYALDVDLVLPGHRNSFADCKGRIRELQHHHEVRANEVLSILEDGRKNAYQVASRMTWDIECDSWELFPVTQKWFATGEALAHLKYLEGKELIQGDVQKGRVLFSLR